MQSTAAPSGAEFLTKSAAVLLEFPGTRAGGAAEHERRVTLAVHKHLAVVWRVLRRTGLLPADADDATQDVFWVFARRVTEVAEASERSFLVAVALRVASDRRRSKWSRRATEPIDPETCVSDALQPDEALAQRRGRALLDEVLDSLGTPEREVFVLIELEQMTRDEVAEVLKIPAGTVASRLRRAREDFRSAAERVRARGRRYE